MPASFLLATEDRSLLDAWANQVPEGRPRLSLADVAAYPSLPAGVPIVVVLDAILADRLPSMLERCPMILVGRPHTSAFEQMRLSGRPRQTLSYELSGERLREFLPLLEEVAERSAALDLMMEKSRRLEPSRAPFTPNGGFSNSPELWDFLEGAVENIASRERLLSEFRRASRHLLHASHTVFFLRDESGFRADRGASHCPSNDPLVRYLSSHPVVLDGVDWPGPADPLAEMAVRNRMALWGARLLVPMHDNGHLIGMIACGVRDDGQAYGEADKARAVFVARLLRQFLTQSQQFARCGRMFERNVLGERYLPSTLLLGPEEEPPRQVPLAVRALVGKARHQRDTQRLRPSAGQPFRASAGLVEETGGVWAFWEEASGEVEDMAQDQRRTRLELLRDLALTLNHEIGNSLVSLGTLRHAATRDALPAGLRETVLGDLGRLEKLNSDLVHMANFADMAPEQIDLRDVLQRIGEALEIKVELPPDPVEIRVVTGLVSFAFEALARTVAENQPAEPEKRLTVQLRATGEGDERTALVSVQGSGLELEGILPDASPDMAPNQGRLTVFIAKEIVRLHGGEIHAGPGLAGTEILISLRKW